MNHPKTMIRLANDLGLSLYPIRYRGTRDCGYQFVREDTKAIVFELSPWRDRLSDGKLVWNIRCNGYPVFQFGESGIEASKDLPAGFEGTRRTAAAIRQLVSDRGIPKHTGFIRR